MIYRDGGGSIFLKDTYLLIHTTPIILIFKDRNTYTTINFKVRGWIDDGWCAQEGPIYKPG